MPRLMIDGQWVEAVAGSTILQAALSVGIRIPTLCFQEGLPPNPACLVCMVKEKVLGRLLPACGSLVEEGMDIDTQSAEVHRARQTALQLLVNDHRGNCTAPCRRSCPADLDIPRMLHLVMQNRLPEAFALARRSLVFPGILGRICPAYCEKGCRANGFLTHPPEPVAAVIEPVEVTEAPVLIREIHRLLAETNQSSLLPLPAQKAATGKKIAVVGAGPAGLATAFYLLQEGHSCHLFDQRDKPGGSLNDINEELVPGGMVEREIEIIWQLGAKFFGGIQVGKDRQISALQADYEAVVLTCGVIDASFLDNWGLIHSEKGVQVNPHTLATFIPGLYAGGAMIHRGRAAVKSIADAKTIAASITRFFNNNQECSPAKPFQSRFKRTVVNSSAPKTRASEEPNNYRPGVADIDCALREAARCRQCGCWKADNCRLRDYATEYQIRPNYEIDSDCPPAANPVIASYTGDYFRIDHGKCIRCGICVRICEKAGVRAGFTFLGRGYETYIGIPFDLEPDEAFQRIIPDCITHCPTGALNCKEEKKNRC